MGSAWNASRVLRHSPEPETPAEIWVVKGDTEK